MKLDLADTLALLDRLIESQPMVTKPGGFSVRLRRLRDLLELQGGAEPRFSDIAEHLFPGVSKDSLRATWLEFRKSFTRAADVAGVNINFIRPDARGKASGEVRCHFEGAPLPQLFDSSAEQIALGRENEVIGLRARATRIFVSFAMADQKLSKEFTDQLKVNLPLRFQEPVSLWRFDEKGGILPGEENEEIIRQKMQESQFGILLVSPVYLSRPFIQKVELPHFIGPDAKARPMPVALKDFSPGQDKHPLLDPKNVFTHKDKDYYQTPPKERGAFIKALCDHIAALVEKYATPPAAFGALPARPSLADDFRHLCPELRSEDGEYIHTLGRRERSLAKSAGRPEDEAAEASVDVLETLHDWVRDPNESAYMAVLGEAGAGKTMTCSKLAHALNAKHPGSCIYIDLRRLNESGLLKANPNPKLEEILAAVLDRGTTGRKITPAVVLQAVRERGALLIWDGLDEVLVHISAQEGDAFFVQLKQALPSRLVRQPVGNPGRLIVVCRTHYFRSFEHEASALTEAQRGSVSSSAPDDHRARFKVLRLLPFEDDQIRAYLEANVPGVDLERAMEVIHEVHNLHDLAQRPYCLSLMRPSLPELDRSLAAGKKIRTVDLYRSFVRSWLARDGTKHRFDEGDKPRLMACLAAWMWREGAKSLTAERLGQWLKETVVSDPAFLALYGDAFKDPRKRDELLQDFRTATFIARWDGDSFRFAHTSLQEYFLACHLVQALEAGFLEEWALPRVNRETFDFAAELYAQRSGESTAARERLKEGLTTLLQKVVPGRSENAFAFLLRLHAAGETNVTIISADLRRLDLTALEIAGVPGRPLHLPRADFSGTRLLRSRLHHVELEDSKWLGADLRSAEFVSCGLERADFSSGATGTTRFEGGRLRACRLNGSRAAADTAGLRLELPVWDSEAEESWRSTSVHLRRVFPGAGLAWACWNLGHLGGVRCVLYSPDGRQIVSASWDGSLRVWDAINGECLRKLKGHYGAVNCVSYSPDGTRFVTGSWDKSIRVWDAASGNYLLKLKGHVDVVESVAYSPDGSRIVSGSRDASLRVWDAKSGKLLRQLNGHKNAVECVSFSPDGSRIVSCSWDRSIRVWDAESGKCLRELKGHNHIVESVSYSPNGTQIASASHDRKVRVWDAASGVCLLEMKGHSRNVRSVAYSPDGSRIVSGASDGSLREWDATMGKCLRVLEGHAGRVRCVSYSPLGNRIVSGASDGCIRLWEDTSDGCLRELGGHSNAVVKFWRSKDECRIVGTDIIGRPRAWSAVTGVEMVYDNRYMEDLQKQASLSLGTIRYTRPDGVEQDIAPLPDGGYAVLERAPGEKNWRLVRAKGEYWRYVNYATEGPEGRVLWPADILGSVPEV